LPLHHQLNEIEIDVGLFVLQVVVGCCLETDNMDIANSVDVQLMYFQLIVTCKTSLARGFSFFCWTSKVSLWT
jgi:hypothetical protein